MRADAPDEAWSETKVRTDRERRKPREAGRISVSMRLLRHAIGTVVILVSLAASIALGGCKRSNTGSASGKNPSNTGGQSPNSAANSSTSGNGGTDGQQKAGKPGSSNAAGQGQTQTQGDATEPANTVSGQPSVDSDRGSPRAVAHRSVAQPGAPQGTIPNQAAHGVQKAAPQQR
jgi:hypothetical protein